jgi:hypothetical protein
VIEEDERADHPALRERQHAAHFEASEVAPALRNDEVDHDGCGWGEARYGEGRCGRQAI